MAWSGMRNFFGVLKSSERNHPPTFAMLSVAQTKKLPELVAADALKMPFANARNEYSSPIAE